MKGVITDEEIEMISKFYNLDAQMLLSEANIFTNSNIEGRPNSAVECCVWMRDNGQRDVLPLIETLAVIPVTSCSAEHSFSCLRRLKNYTRSSTMDQDRLSSLAMCTIHRETANKVINNDIELLGADQQICGKTWKEYTLFLIRCRCTYSYSV